MSRKNRGYCNYYYYYYYCRSRDYGGVRIHYAEPSTISLAEWWNPWSRAMPYVTLTHHLLAYNQLENETVTYNADEFAETLVMALDAAKKRAATDAGTDAGPEPDTTEPIASMLDDKPIMINSYAGLQSIVFNQSKFGYYLERGGYSF